MYTNKYIRENRNLSYLVLVILLIFTVCIIYYVINNASHFYSLFRAALQPKIYGDELNKKIANKTYSTKSKYADVIFKVSEDGESINVTVNYKDVSDVGVIHIHSVMWGHEKSGDIGPPIGWLGTTNEWQNGVRQLTPGLSYPCCTRGKGFRCDFIAPPGTPDLKDLSFKTRNFVIKKDFCYKECPWIYNGTYIVFHGKKIQQVYDGCLTKGTPNPDILNASQMDMIHMKKFEEVNN